MNGRVLYSRSDDGCRPVRLLSEGYEVICAGGKVKRFTTAQGLLAELTGHPTGRHWSLERYFGVGKHGSRSMGKANVLDLFAPKTSTTVILQPLAPSLDQIHKNLKNRAEKNSAARERFSVRNSSGIDLSKKSEDVRRLLFAGYGRRIFAAGYDPEDVLQEVYQKILVANRGRNPWDPSQGSFGNYVHMVCGSALSNYHRKHKRIRDREQLGVRSLQKDGMQVGDVGQATHLAAPQTGEMKDYLLNEAADDLIEHILDTEPHDSTTHLAIAIIPHVAAGEARKAIASDLDISMAALSRAISRLRASTARWGGRA